MPYPIYDQTGDMHSKHGAWFGQSTAEDFLRPQRPLPSPLVEIHGSDHDLPVIEPDSYLYSDSSEESNKHPASSQPSNLDAIAPRRHPTETNAKSSPHLGHTPTSENPRPGLPLPPHAPSLQQEPTPPNFHACVQSVSSDMCNPAFGGLQKMSDIRHKESRCDRIKRAMNRLSPPRYQILSGLRSRR